MNVKLLTKLLRYSKVIKLAVAIALFVFGVVASGIVAPTGREPVDEDATL